MSKPIKREYDFSRGKRGPVLPVPRGKTRITTTLRRVIREELRHPE